jgi:hypothetical protein
MEITMPVDMNRYPKNWPQISLRIRLRAEGICECEGECGAHHGRCTASNYGLHPVTGSKVIFTVAHLGVDLPDGTKGNKHNKMDVRDENLKAMCQYCHLNFDRDEHLENRKATARRILLDAGQMEMPL